VMEHCTGGELFERIVKNQKFDEHYSSRLFE